ncbi:MAG: ATP-dependent RecD-like DNA helicase, partial [Oscillospiraceae bacterium]|nr:ATP-dependent RecD-like DNA helicase [Oscillospiraceae bacterium]
MQQTQLYGIVDSVSYHNEDSGFTVLELICEDELIIAVGTLPEVFPGEELRLQGSWGSHPNFGRQFKAESYQRFLPASAEAILRYLSSGAIKGIGPVSAASIVAKFGENTLEIMEKEPARLSEIKGISKSKAEKIAEEYRKQFGMREAMLFLDKFGITPSEALRIWKKLGSSAVHRVQENPYILCSEGVNIGFYRADEIAAQMEKPEDDNRRIKAGLLYVLRHNLGNGHTCLPFEKLITVTSQLLGISQELVEQQYEQSIFASEIAAQSFGGREFVFLMHMYQAERYCAGRLRLMLDFPPEEIKGTRDEIAQIESAQGIA